MGKIDIDEFCEPAQMSQWHRGMATAMLIHPQIRVSILDQQRRHQDVRRRYFACPYAVRDNLLVLTCAFQQPLSNSWPCFLGPLGLASPLLEGRQPAHHQGVQDRVRPAVFVRVLPQ